MKSNITKVYELLCIILGITPTQFDSHMQNRKFTKHRQLIILYLINIEHATLKSIGILTGNTTHRNVIYHRDIAIKKLLDDANFKYEFLSLVRLMPPKITSLKYCKLEKL